MKFKKLNPKGFSHEVIMIAVVALVAIAGVAYLVASHADPVAHTASKKCISQTFRPGSSGHCVKDIQWGVSFNEPPLVIDGKYGQATTTYVKNFQRHYHLTVDGTVGSKTWNIICQNDRGMYRISASQAAGKYGKDAGCKM